MITYFSVSVDEIIKNFQKVRCFKKNSLDLSLEKYQLIGTFACFENIFHTLAILISSPILPSLSKL